MNTVDLRSDTVTRPTPEMRRVMAEAEVGDDVYGEDPSVNRLEAMAAERLGKEAAVFVTSGTQGNLVALLTHCGRGDELIAGDQAHTYRYEGGGAAALGGIHMQPAAFDGDGRLDLGQVDALVKPDDSHFARTRLLCLENTHNGSVLPLSYLEQAKTLADARGLATHLDGARVFNAALADGVDVADIARHFDSVSFCLSKGLGAPVGSLLCGERAFIAEARRWRKKLGGGLRQAGVLAAAGIYALEHNVARLAEDHANAERLAEGLTQRLGEAAEIRQATNMVFIRAHVELLGDLAAELARHQVKISERGRLVTHLDVNAADIERVLERVAAWSGAS